MDQTVDQHLINAFGAQHVHKVKSNGAMYRAIMVDLNALVHQTSLDNPPYKKSSDVKNRKKKKRQMANSMRMKDCALIVTKFFKFPGPVPKSLMRSEMRLVRGKVGVDYVVSEKTDGKRYLVAFLNIDGAPRLVFVNRGKVDFYLVSNTKLWRLPTGLFEGTVLDVEIVQLYSIKTSPPASLGSGTSTPVVATAVSSSSEANSAAPQQQQQGSSNTKGNLYGTTDDDGDIVMSAATPLNSSSSEPTSDLKLASDALNQSHKDYHSRYCILAFDLFAFRGEQCFEHDYRTRHTIARMAIGTITDVRADYNAKSASPAIAMKPIFSLGDRKALETHRKCKKHKDDGYIFTAVPMALNHEIENAVFKLKAQYDNTIDFKVCVESVTATHAHLVLKCSQLNVPSGQQQQQHQQRRQQKRYRLIDYCTSVVPLSRMGAKMDPDMLHNCIAECRYDADSKQWIPFKLRPNKPFPNELLTVRNTVQNIQENIVIEEIMKMSPLDTVAGEQDEPPPWSPSPPNDGEKPPPYAESV